MTDEVLAAAYGVPSAMYYVAGCRTWAYNGAFDGRRRSGGVPGPETVSSQDVAPGRTTSCPERYRFRYRSATP